MLGIFVKHRDFEDGVCRDLPSNKTIEASQLSLNSVWEI